MASNITTNSIALRIAGTKQRQAGFAPLATVGVLAGNEGANMDKVLMVSEKPAFLLKHAEDYILYMLVDRKVKSFDADASGVLSIALTIGRSVCLAGGKSPYDLLMEVYETFRSRYMTPVSDGRDAFQNTDIDSDVFREIVARYPLIERAAPYVPMQPDNLSGILCVPQPLLSDFFRDTQFKEFASFRDIEVGSDCLAMVSPGLDKLQVPRPISYRVQINGKPTGQSLNAPSDVCRASVPDTPLAEFEPVAFSLEEVLSAPGGVLEKDGAVIRLNPVTETIACQLKQKEIKYAVVTTISSYDERDRNEVKEAYLNGEIRIQLDGRDITADLAKKTPMRQDDVMGHKLTISGGPSRFLLSIHASPDHQEKKLKFTIGVSRKAVAVPPVGGPEQGGSEPDPGKQSGTKPFILGLLAGLLIGAIAVFLVFYFMKPKEETPVVSQKPEQTVTDTTKTGPAQDLMDPAAESQETPSETSETTEPAPETPEETKTEEPVAQQEAPKAEEKPAQPTEADINEARKAVVDLFNAGNAYATVAKSDKFKMLPPADRYLLERIFNYIRYDDSKGYQTGTVKIIKETVTGKFPLTWGQLKDLDADVADIAKERKK